MTKHDNQVCVMGTTTIIRVEQPLLTNVEPFGFACSQMEDSATAPHTMDEGQSIECEGAFDGNKITTVNNIHSSTCPHDHLDARVRLSA